MKADNPVWKFLKRFLLACVLIIFALAVFAFVVLPPKGYIPILMYHFVVPKVELGTSSLNVSVDAFNRQMWFLKTFGFRVISLDELYEIKTGKRQARGRELVVTFDDGHLSYLKYALPILDQYHIKSANFIIWEHLFDKWPDDMTLTDVKQIAGDPLVILGSHTLSHPNLREVSPEQARKEIFESKENLEQALGKKVHYLSYPGGSFDPTVAQLVQEAGHRLAFRTAMKHLTGYPDTLYSLARIKVSPKQDLFLFWLNISGFIEFGKKIDASFHQLTGAKASDKLHVYGSSKEMT